MAIDENVVLENTETVETTETTDSVETTETKPIETNKELLEITRKLAELETQNKEMAKNLELARVEAAKEKLLNSGVPEIKLENGQWFPDTAEEVIACNVINNLISDIF